MADVPKGENQYLSSILAISYFIEEGYSLRNMSYVEVWPMVFNNNKVLAKTYWILTLYRHVLGRLIIFSSMRCILIPFSFHRRVGRNT